MARNEAGKKGLSRRQLLKGGAAVAGLAAGSGAITGFPTIWAQNIKDITLVHIGQSFSTIPAIGEQATKDLGFKIEMQTVDYNTHMKRLFTQPETIDISDVGFQQMNDFVGRNVLQAIPIDKYKWWDKTVPLFTSGTYPDGRKASLQGIAPYPYQYTTDREFTAIHDGPSDFLSTIPSYYNGDTLGIRPDLIGRQIESWSEMFNPEFKGKTALMSMPEVGVVDAAMAIEAAGLITYANKGDMTIDEIDKTMAILLDLKRQGHFRSFWDTFEQSVSLMASGEAVIQSMWSMAVTEVRSRGIECEFVPLKEGYRGWGMSFGAMAHLDGLKLDAAYEYLNWTNSGWMGAFIGRQGFYNSVPDNVKGFMSEAEYGYWYEGKPADDHITDPFGKVMETAGRVRDGGSLWDRMGNVAMWNTVMKEQRYLAKRWNELLSV